MDDVTLLRTFGDKIERDFYDKICDKFPRYAELWARFVGNEGHAKPLGYTSLKTLDEKEKEKLEKDYKSLYQSHYTMFFHLVGMHTQIKAYSEELSRDLHDDSYYSLRAQGYICFK